jgi:hypothetical protein
MFDEIRLQNSIKGKLESTKEKFRSYFLLLFTKELIRHSKEEFFELENTIRHKERRVMKILPKRNERRIMKIMPRKNTSSVIKNPDEEKYVLSLMNKYPRARHEEEFSDYTPQIFKTNINQQRKQIPENRIIHKKQYRPLFIPEAPLPPTVQYLQPSPTNILINLGKLEPLAQDPKVRTIECNGPDEPIIVKGSMGTRTTNIILNKNEINEVLLKFSQISKIPLSEGIFKIAAGRYVISAIVSEIVGSKFLIRKMAPQMPPSQMNYY